MEAILQEIVTKLDTMSERNIRIEIKLDEVMSELNNLRQEQVKMKQEMNNLRTENNNLQKRMEILESKIENNERKDRRNNIVIKGIEINGKTTNHDVQEFLKSKLNIEAEIEETKVISTCQKPFVIAKLKRSDDKLKIMKEKKILRNTRIYIDEDRTQTELNIQAKMREIGNQEKQKGNEVKIGFKKIWINKELWIWNEKQQLLIPKN